MPALEMQPLWADEVQSLVSQGLTQSQAFPCGRSEQLTCVIWGLGAFLCIFSHVLQDPALQWGVIEQSVGTSEQ